MRQSDMTESELADALAIPAAVAFSYGSITQFQAPLFPEEDVAIQQAIGKRQVEFRAGRTAARRALAQLGVPRHVIPRAADRSPVWPRGIVGSISHSDTFVVAAVSQAAHIRAIGIDIETEGRVPRDLWRLLFSASEQAALQAAPAWAPVLFFAAKEAFYKLQYPLTKTPLGFLDLEVTLTQTHECALRMTKESPSALLQTALDISFCRCANEVIAFCQLDN